MERLFQLPVVRSNRGIRSFLNGFWLGWQIETNWADPLIFIIYFVARPIASLWILVVMYSVIAADSIGTPFFAYVYLGSALYLLVAQIVVGVSWVVIEDREQYRVAKQIYTSPVNGYMYILGRGVSRFVVSMLSVSITIPFGVLAFGIPITLSEIQFPLLIVSTVLGLTAMASFGLILGAVTYQVTRQAWFIGDAVSGLLYLFTGAVFPIDTLPEGLRTISLLLPSTYWLELARRALLGDSAYRFQQISTIDDGTLLLLLAIMSIVFLSLSMVVYRWSTWAARDRGVLDMESNF